MALRAPCETNVFKIGVTAIVCVRALYHRVSDALARFVRINF
jgi:hypothetical protein